MADRMTSSTQQQQQQVGKDKEKKGLKKSLKRFKEKLKGSKKSGKRSASGTGSTISYARPPAPAALHAPTTSTTISSPNDPRNTPNASRSGSLVLRPPNPRRNTAPADFFNTTAAPRNTITTTITASAPPKTKLRYRLSLSNKRASVQPRLESRLDPLPPSPGLASPAPSAPEPLEHENQRATFQFTTAAQIEAQTQVDRGQLLDAADVIRRDKPKDWVDPLWRQKQELETQRALAERKQALLEVTNVNVGRAATLDGPLRRWEWGK